MSEQTSFYGSYLRFLKSKSAISMLVIAALALAGIVTVVVRMQSSAPLSISAMQNVSAMGPLRIPFPEAMNTATVEHELILPAVIEGSVSWEGTTLVFTPKENLDAGETYEFVVGRNAQRADGSTLGKDMVFRFVVTGAPAVSARTPSPSGTDVPLNAKITIVFDRPMVPLTQVQGTAAMQQWSGWPVTITPALSGQWRWISTYAAQFAPEGGLLPATLYSVAVPAGIATQSGEKTEKDASWSFETERPRVVTTEPVEGYSLAGPSTQITLHFNQEVSAQSAAKHLTLYRGTYSVPNGSGSALQSPVVASGTLEQIPIKSVEFGTAVEEQESSSARAVTDHTSIIVTPGTPLAQNSTYSLVLSPGMLGTRGDLGTKEEMALHFSTVGPLSVLSTQFQYGSLTLKFSSPISAKIDSKDFKISPKPADWDSTTFALNDWDDSRTMTVSPPQLEPSTTYTLTLPTSFTDIYGQHLAAPYTYSFTTPPTTPEVALAYSKGDFGIFERDKPPVYYINDVNVSAVKIEFARLTVQEFMDMRSQKALNPQFVPDLRNHDLYQSWSLTAKAKQNAWESVPFDVAKRTGSPLAPGIYAMLIRAPEFVQPSTQSPAVVEQYFAVTNTALTLKFSGDKALVWATNLQTGEPVKGAAIAFHSLHGTVPVTGTTDASGFFETPISMQDFKNQAYEWQPEFWVTAQTADDFAFVSSAWNGGFSPGDFSLWSDFHSADAPPFRLMQEVITDRPVYRPGDTVSFKGIARLKDWNGVLQLPGKDRQMQVVIQDGNGTEVYRKRLPFSEFGGFSDSFKTADNAYIGSYSFLLQLIPEGDAGDQVYAQGFSVLAYRKPEYKVDVTTGADDYFSGQSIDTDIAGAYYFGAPMSNAKVQWSLQLLDYYFNRYTDGWYSFSTEDAWCWRDCAPASAILTQGKGTLDAAGHMHVSIPVSIDDKKVSQIATIEATVSDPNNQQVSNRVSVPVHKSGVYVGIRNDDYAVAPGETAHVGIITVDPKGKPVANHAVTLRMYSRTWNTVKKKGVDGQYYYDNQPVDTFIHSQNETTGDDGKLQAGVVLPTGGQFEIVAEASDDQGRTAKAGTSLYAWSSTYVNWPHDNNNRIDLVADKPEYAVGDTAKLLVKSPFQGKGVKALVTVERENVLTKKVIDVTGNALPIEIPITEDFVPNVYVSVVIVKPRMGETFDNQGHDTGVPAFRVGYAQLHVQTKRKALTVTVETDKKQYLPGEKVTATVKAVDSTGKPVRGEFTLATVDMSVLALAGFEKPDLVANFYTDHGLGVFTSQMLTYLIERFKPGSKGGGGGDLENRKRGNFRDTAYWNPAVMTDANGSATVSFTLPDNLTTWQLLALGDTKDGKFGGGVKEVVATKNVILRPVQPRFAVRGDQITLGAIVQNFLPDAKSFTVRISGSGLLVTGKNTQTVTLNAGEMTKVEFPIAVGSADSLTIDMSADAKGARDEIEQKIPVYLFGTPQSVTTTGQTQSLVTETVHAPSLTDASEGSLKITLSPTIASYLPAGLDYVYRYPYGCAEQTASAFLPQLALKKLQGFDAFKIVPDRDLEANVLTGLQKLYAFQKPDGGFGYWPESYESQPYLTAYIVYALHAAQSSGYAVDAAVLKRATDYLANVLHTSNTLEGSSDLAVRTYILYVLAETGNADANLLSNLYDKRQNLPVFSLAELAMALQKAGMQAKAKDALTHVLDGAMIDPRGAHVEERHQRAYQALMQTNTRTTAETLQAMLRLDPGNVLVPQFMRYLLSIREAGHWDTTQSTVQTILAFVEYLKSSNELSADYTAGVEVNGTMKATQHFGKQNILTRTQVTILVDDLLRGKDNTVKIGLDASAPVGTGSSGKLFYDMELSYFFTGDTIAPADEGMSITRTLAPLDKDAPVTSVKVGDTYRVTLTMTVPEERHFVAVESPFPAGLEGVDLNLQTSQQNGLPQEITQQDAPGYWWMDDEEQNALGRFAHREFRDDRVFLFADDLPAGVYTYTYLVRATTPGRFRLRPARMWEMYFPETFGQTDGGWFTVTE